jgi:hypothetical protein
MSLTATYEKEFTIQKVLTPDTNNPKISNLSFQILQPVSFSDGYVDYMVVGGFPNKQEAKSYIAYLKSNIDSHSKTVSVSI